MWNIPSSVTKTCVYHDIPVFFGISQVMFKYKTLNQVRLGYLCLSKFNKRYPGITRHVTYPGISL